MSKFFIFISLIILFFSTGSWVNAQSSASKTTRVGNPPEGVKGDFVFYCQGDPKWDDRASCGLGQAGCGPTSLAMVFSTFGQQTSPTEMFQIFKTTPGWWVGGCASNMLSILESKWLKDQGFTTASLCSNCQNINVDSLRKYLGEGYLIIGSSQSFPCVSCRSASKIDHIFVVDGVNEADGTISIRDPNNCNYADGKEIQAHISRNKINGSFLWYYAYAIKKL